MLVLLAVEEGKKWAGKEGDNSTLRKRDNVT